MRCPNCSATMEPGDVVVDQTGLSWLSGYPGGAELRFKGAKSGKLTVLKGGGLSRAFHCEACGTLVMATDQSREAPPAS